MSTDQAHEQANKQMKLIRDLINLVNMQDSSTQRKWETAEPEISQYLAGTEQFLNFGKTSEDNNDSFTTRFGNESYLIKAALLQDNPFLKTDL